MHLARLSLSLVLLCVVSPLPPAAAETPAAKKLPTLLDLGSTQCAACKTMAPIIDTLAKDFSGRLQVSFIDVNANPKAAETWKIEMIPTLIFLDADGKELFRHVGTLTREEILAKWKELGFEFMAPTAVKN